MKPQLSIIGLSIFFMVGIQAVAPAEVTISLGEYQGWSGAYRISNGTVELVVVPQIGRIMRYGYVNGPNMLWNNPDLLGKTADPEAAAKEWPNFGGDKLWPAPQDHWKWPPDPVIDSGHLLVQALPNRHLLITGQPGSSLGVQFSREIILAPTGTDVTFKNTMRNTSKQKQTWGVWEVFQTNAPSRAGIPLNRSGHFSQGYFNFGKTPPGATTDNDTMLLTRDPANSYKVGSDAPMDTLWAEIQGQRFEISARYEPGQPYPDSGCAEEVYSDPDPLPYMELELLAPIHTLSPGKTTTFITRWRIEAKT